MWIRSAMPYEPVKHRSTTSAVGVTTIRLLVNVTYESYQMENSFINNEASAAPFSSWLSPSLPPAVVTTALSYVWAALIRVMQ